MSEIKKALTREHERDLLEQLLHSIDSLSDTTSEAIGRLTGTVLHSVLLNELIPFDSTGVITRRFGARIGSALVLNYTTTDLYTFTGPPDATAPGQGVGVNFVPAGTWLSMPVGGHQFTIYGAANAGKITLQAVTNKLAFGRGNLS